MAHMLFDLTQKSISYNPGSTMALFADVFKAMKYQKLQGKWYPTLLADYIEFYFEHYVKDDIDFLREGFTFLLSFVLDSPDDEENSEEIELILSKIYAIINEVPFSGCIPDCDLSGFLPKIGEVMARVRDLYVATPLSSQFHPPRNIHAPEFLDSLLETLQSMLQGGVKFIPSVNNQVLIVQERLESLRPFFNLELNDDDDMLKDLRREVDNVVHHASYVIKLCPITSSSIWYGIICLPNVIQHLNLVNSEVKKVADNLHIYSAKKVTIEMGSSNVSQEQATTSKHEGAFIGFEEDVQSILDELLGGREDLAIISISGMPGQGKTTLAKRICNDPSVKRGFHEIKWCYVFKECTQRKLLARILGGDDGENVDANIEIQDLIERVWRRLKGKRYLIVLDDIWDVELWRQVQGSFPEDKKKSRILFTSRNHDLAIQCKPNSTSHRLPLLTFEESLKLMKHKLSYRDGFPRELEHVGKLIASYYNGLPLGIVLIASLLKSMTPRVDVWMEVAKNLKPYLEDEDEGCRYIIEQSYKYLPHHLKLCFLYLGLAFQKDENIYAGKLIRLWIAEGFIAKKEGRCSTTFARECLDYLVAQNLVIVTGRSSMGKIKRCMIHDLLYDFCLQKALDDSFISLEHCRTAIHECCRPNPQKYDFHHHWLCILDNIIFTNLALHSHSTRHKSPTSQVQSVLWSLRDVALIPYKSLSSFLNSFGVLTVLYMMDVNLCGSEFPTIVLHNTNLRYLALRGSFSRVPELIAKLWQLETLILFPVKYNLWLPDSLWKIKTLSFVRIRNFYVGVNVSSMAAVSNIETLNGIILHDRGQTMEFLMKLSRLRKLQCSFRKEVRPEFLSMFRYLGKLESLTISVLNFQGLGFKQDWGGLELNFSDTLKKLSLWRLELPWRVMSTIGKLPNLQVLKLVYNACKGTTWNLGDGEFSNLKYLKLFGMNVKQINDSDCESPFPRLEQLFLIDCDRLEEIPLSFGDIYTLETIHLESSPKAVESLNAVVEQQRDTGNETLQVVVLDHDDNASYYFEEVGGNNSDDDDDDNNSNEDHEDEEDDNKNEDEDEEKGDHKDEEDDNDD